MIYASFTRVISAIVFVLLFLSLLFFFFFFFFFSSRRRHTRCLSHWSSDVCSSDLARGGRDRAAASSRGGRGLRGTGRPVPRRATPSSPVGPEPLRARPGAGRRRPLARGRGGHAPRSEERRVGKEGRSRWSP